MPERMVIWWNVQRLLAPTGSRLSRALDATAAAGWTRAAYRTKLEHLGAVLREVGGGQVPALLALAEVENDRVADQLLDTIGWTSLRLIKDPAARLVGNDLVLFHDPAALRLQGTARSYNVHTRFATRDLFEAQFATPSGAELTVVTAHWPSRRISNSVALRIGLADYTLRLVEDHLKFSKDDLIDARGRAAMRTLPELLARWERPVLLVGDYNDSPFDTSVADVLGAKRMLRSVLDPPRLPRGRGLSAVAAYLERKVRLYNPTWQLLTDDGGPTGTHYWDGDWYMLDQLILSRGLVSGQPVRYVENSLHLHAPRTVPGPRGTVTVTSAQGIPKAFDPATRTGVSDHLPLSFALELN